MDFVIWMKLFKKLVNIMYKNKKIIFGIILLLFIIVIIIIFKVVSNINENDNSYSDTELREADVEIINSENNKLQKIEGYATLNLVKNCVQKFYLYYNGISSPNSTDSFYRDVTYNLLSPDYINKLGITQENVTSNIEYIENFKIELYEVYSLSKYEENPEDFGLVTAYFVKGVIRNTETYDGIDFNMILTLDNTTSSFEVYLGDYLADVDFNGLKEGEEINFDIPQSVENRDYNKFSSSSTTIEDIAEYRFDNVKTILLYDIDRAYEYLNEQAKSNEFKTIDEFKSFIDSNKNNMYFMLFSTYEIRYEDGVMILDCYDQTDTYCISLYCNNYSELNYSISLI